MKVHLIFPPFVESALTGPHLAPYLLKAVLESQGVVTEVADFNIAVIRLLLEPGALERFSLPETTGAEERTSQTGEIGRRALNRRRRMFERIRQRVPKTLAAGWSRALRNALAYVRGVVFPKENSIDRMVRGETAVPANLCDLYLPMIGDLGISAGDAVGFSVAFAEQLEQSFWLARLVRRQHPGARLMLGGSQVNLLQEAQLSQLASAGLFDVISVGNGEQTICQAVTRSQPDEIVVRSGPMRTAELQRVPSANFGKLGQYFEPLSIPVLVTKGCYWGQCSFCDYVKLSDLGPERYIARAPDKVLSEIRDLQNRYNPDTIRLISDAIPPVWYRELSVAARDQDVDLRTWSYMMHWSGLNTEYFSDLARAGVRAITFGTESFDDRLLRVMRKQATSETAVQNLRAAKSAGIAVSVNVIPDYPTTTFSEAMTVAAVIEENLDVLGLLNPQMFDLTAATPVSRTPTLYGIEIVSDAYTRSSHGHHSIEFTRVGGLSAWERNVVRSIYHRLAAKSRLRRRISKLDRADVIQRLWIDSSAYIEFAGEDYVLVLSSLDIEIPVFSEDRELYSVLTERYHGEIARGTLCSLFEEFGPSRARRFEEWFDDFLSSGLVVATGTGLEPDHFVRRRLEVPEYAQ